MSDSLPILIEPLNDLCAGAPLGSRRNLIIDPLGSYPGEVNPTDPAADIIRQLFAILPAPNVSLPAVELESASAMEPVGIPPAQTSVTELELGVETENAAPELATQGQGASASLEIVAPVPTDIQPAHRRPFCCHNSGY